MPHTTRSLLAASALAPLLLTGCLGKGGGRDYGELLTLDEAVVNDRLDRLEAIVPACRTSTASAARSARMPVAGTGTSGSCGGAVEVDTAHESGITDYDLRFASFCMSGTQAGDVVLDGMLAGREHGTPSDSGPVIDQFTLESEGPLTVAHDGPDVEVLLEGAVVDYGLPAPWAPDPATAAAPDLAALELLTVHFPGGEEADILIGELELERVGVPAELHIKAGVLALGDEGYVEISTAPDTPFTFGGVEAMSGAVVLTGADDTQLVITPSATTPMAVELELNGQPFARSVDCSATLPFLVQSLAAVYLALPIY